MICSVPSEVVRLVVDPSSRNPYIGLNFSYTCRVVYLLGSLEDVDADVFISAPSVLENSDRVHIDNVSIRGIAFERTLEISPISARDAGNYICTGTVMSATHNPLVTGCTNTTLSQNITIFSECKHLVKPV